MLFFGGLVIASAIEVSRLHERISLKVLLYFGSDPKKYIFSNKILFLMFEF